MKILLLTQYFPPEVGAPQNRLYELAVRLQQKGANITVLTAMPNYPQMKIYSGYEGLKYKYEEMDGLKVHRSSIYVSENRGIISRLRNYFSFVQSSWKTGKNIPGNFDYIFCESPPLFLGITAVRLARRKKAKLIFNVSDLWPESAEKLGVVQNKLLLWLAYKLESWIYRNSSLITCQTQGIQASISSRFPEKRTYWLPNGSDLSFYNPAQFTNAWKNKNGFKENDFLLLYGGILGIAQGLEVIVQAAYILKEHPSIHFIMVGSGPEKAKLQRLISELNTRNVHLLDGVSKTEMPNILAAVDAGIIPLKKLELFKGAIPSKIFECLAMKKPVLLGVEGEAQRLFIEEGHCGIAFEPENAQSLSQAILTLFQNRPLAEKMGEAGRNFVDKNFNRNRIAESFWNILQS